jgi:eukaryotic-like serine/threonine-protein kinase
MEHPARVGKYQIDQFLGGGMSHVYRATDTVLGRRVALKILTEEGTSDEESKARFLMEARVASNVRHENVISVYDFGEDRGRPFIVMEYLEGESLRVALRHGRLGDFRRRINLALQVARAIDFIHSQKVIHRDIKPENIHIDASGKIKLMDFGIAKAAGMQLTKAGFTLGTPFYMAPEQVLGRPLGPQADVYSFGALLYELLTGSKAVEGENVDRIFENILYTPVDLTPLESLRLPPALIALIARMLDKRPAERPASLGLVADEMERIINPSHAAPGWRLHHQHLPRADEEDSENIPGFIHKLPGWLKTETAMMTLGCAGVTLLIVTVYLVWTWN